MTRHLSVLRLASQWVLAVLLIAVLAALFVLTAAVQVTSEETGIRAQRRSVATLTELDRLIPKIEAELDEIDVPATGTVQVPGFPIPVELTPEEAETLRGAALRERILDGAAALLYEDGMDAWAATDPDGVQRIERVSAAGAVEEGMGLAHDSRNTLFLTGAVLLGTLALLLALLLMVAIRDWNMRLVALGSVVFAAGLPCLAAAIAVRFAFKTAQTDGDPFVAEMLDLGIDVIWVPIRDYLTLSAVGFAVAALGALGGWLQARTTQRAPIAGPPPAG